MRNENVLHAKCPIIFALLAHQSTFVFEMYLLKKILLCDRLVLKIIKGQSERVARQFLGTDFGERTARSVVRSALHH